MDSKPLPDHKKSKEIFTFIFSRNADGFDKFEPMIIGKAAIRRPIKERTGRELGFAYQSTNRDWMTSSLFLE